MAYFKMLSMNLEKAPSRLNHIPYFGVEASDANPHNCGQFIFGDTPGQLAENFFGARGLSLRS